MSSFEYLTNYYNNYDEDKRLLTKCGLVEYLTTMKYIAMYLKTDARICEIGAGTGRYSHALACKGYHVDAVELVERNIEIFNKNTKDNEKITIRQGDAMDLSFFDDNSYDITLLLGPMYHLFTKEDKVKALSEAHRITKEGGIVFVAYCIADASIIGHGFKKGNIHDLIEKKMLDTENFKALSNPWDIFELHRKEDIDDLISDLDVKRLHYVASDGFTNHMQDTVEAMDDKTFEIYLKYHFSICEREDMMGMTHHSLDILKKI